MAQKMDFKSIILNGDISPLIPEAGGGLSMEAHLVKVGNKKYVVRMCSSEKRAKFYEIISKELSRYHILPKLIGKCDKHVFYEYLVGRDLKQNEGLEKFQQVGIICARINNIGCKSKEDINFSFNKNLNELTSGKYRVYTPEEMKEKRRRRPNERHDIRRRKALISEGENKLIKIINKKLILETKAKVCLDAFDVSPANFRISKGNIYFVDMDAIKPKIKGIGIAKCFFGWAKKEKERNAFLEGYFSVMGTNFLTDKYMDLLNLHFLIQALHDRVKLGRKYNMQYQKLKSILKKYN